jgi:hypothetical protein
VRKQKDIDFLHLIHVTSLIDLDLIGSDNRSLKLDLICPENKFDPIFSFLPLSFFFTSLFFFCIPHFIMTSITEKHEEKIEYDIHETKYDTYDEQVQVKNVDDRSLPEEFVEEYQFTWRAAIVGSLLGCLVGKFEEARILFQLILNPLSE